MGRYQKHVSSDSLDIRAIRRTIPKNQGGLSSAVVHLDSVGLFRIGLDEHVLVVPDTHPGDQTEWPPVFEVLSPAPVATVKVAKQEVTVLNVLRLQM